MTPPDLSPAPASSSMGGESPLPHTRWLLLILGGVSALISICSALLYVVVARMEERTWRWDWLWGQMFVGEEANVATWWAASLWLMLALVAVAVALVAPRLRLLWFFVALVAVYASVDEATMVHEELYRVGDLLVPLLPFDPFSYTWVVGGIIAIVIVATVLIPLAIRLPRTVLVGLVVAGAMFVLGAVVVETVGGHVQDRVGPETWPVLALIHVEEALEYFGVVLAIAAVASMLVPVRTGDGVAVRFRGYRGQEGPTRERVSRDSDAASVTR
ncbi:MAG: hypothetical protein Q4G21_08685 [Dermabacter sp.]|nr:hypothetical protein [Dermabacter sp.]